MAKAAKPKKEITMEEALWKSADKLRGSVEPAEYKHVVLSLFFLKFASDKFEKQRQKLIDMGYESQIEKTFVLDFNGDGFLNSVTDEDCYYVKDIAKYIFEKYSALGRVSLEVMYKDLDVHPIFPSDGYKNEIKAELKERYYVKATREEIIFSQR